ncbi:hypothetical protein F4861DRAFT_131064 [Xylaria intraflava]|nr:hypothetical protein F4861DRAFT_131064 [Xylaria intraflava]
MVLHSSSSEAPANEAPSGPVDPYALIEALTGRRLERVSLPSRPTSQGYDDPNGLRGLHPESKNGLNPDPKPKDVSVGCINPFALTENLISRKIIRQSIAATRIVQDTLQTDYEELFDMKHHSVLYAGLKLNKRTRMAEQLGENEVKILNEKDLVTPDLGNLDTLGDLERIGMNEVSDIRIKRAGIQNNKLHLVLHADRIAKTVCNNEVTQTINDLCLPFLRQPRRTPCTPPPNSSWRDARGVLMIRSMRGATLSDHGGSRVSQTVRKFDDPIQGAMGNGWFVAALFSVYWANPEIINRNTGQHVQMQIQMSGQHQYFSVKFYDKGGRNNNRTQIVDVDYLIPVNNSTGDFVYCRSSNGMALWPALYEKAFTKWANHGNHDIPGRSTILIGRSGMSGPEKVDVTSMYNGDPVKAMAQINGREPFYYFTKRHQARDLVGLVRSYSVNHRTIFPMVAWTYASDDSAYRGCNLVANHAYSVLGWSSVGQGDKQYIIVRNPWGVTEPHGLTTCPGILTRVEPEHWGPASLLDREGVMAVEVGLFKEYFACMGVSKEEG